MTTEHTTVSFHVFQRIRGVFDRGLPFWTFRTPALRSYSVKLLTWSLRLSKFMLAFIRLTGDNREVRDGREIQFQVL